MNAMLALTPCIVEKYPDESFHIIDGCAWFYNIPWPKVGKLNDLYSLFHASLPKGQGVIVVFDNYENETTKAPEQKRRKGDAPSASVIVKMDTAIPTDRKKFLTCKQNKQKLIDMFSFHLQQEGGMVEHALEDEDADTMIVQQALDKAKDMNVVVHSFDTDVFNALVYHLDINGKSIIMTTRKGLCAINIIATTLDQDLRSCLLIAHAMSGCDAVSATFGMGKVKVFNKLKESPNWRSKLQKLLDDDISVDEMVVLGEEFYIQLYGKIATKATTLDQVRELMYNLPNYIPITRMPPTSRAFRFHMLRIYCKSALGSI